MISKSIKTQSKQIFQNIDYLLSVINDDNINNTIGVFPVWKQLYHLLHSIDQNFINPSHYMEPSFHEKNLNVIYLDSEKTLNRSELLEYSDAIRKKIESYLNELEDSHLEETIIFREKTLTKMELILAQFRHIFYHIGYLHCCFKLLNGQTPEYIGLYKVIPEK